MSRRDDVVEFYALLGLLAERVGGPRHLADCTGKDSWPLRGVYFFFEQGEMRSESGAGPRVVRVGTHCVSEGSKTSLWNRLSQHRGTREGGGNHRGSVFRLWVGDALSRRDPTLHVDSWLAKERRPDTEPSESRLEREVSDYIGQMPFLWAAIGDPASKDSRRSWIERNAIALLSDYEKDARVDEPSVTWLGSHSSSDRVRQSGLWNSNHVEQTYESAFLEELRGYIEATPSGTP